MKLLAFILLVGFSFPTWAKSGFPSILFAPSVGYETGELGNSEYEGLAGQLRLLKIVDSYPFTLFGIDAKYADMQFKDGPNQLEDAERTSAAIVAGFMVPLDLFGINLKNVPEGAGPPIYASYSFYDKISTIDDPGTGYRVGLQLPAGPFAALQVEYSRSDFDNLKLEAWSFYLQFFLPLTTY